VLAATAGSGLPISPGASEQADRILRAAGLLRADIWTVVGAAGERIALVDGGEVTIGRNPIAGVAVVVADPMVSKVHCRVSMRRGAVVAEDVSSTNGTEVRRAGRAIPVTDPVELVPGDVLAVPYDGVPLASVHRGSP